MLFSFGYFHVFPDHSAILLEKRWSLRSGPAEHAHRKNQTDDSRSDAPEDVPHRVLSETPPEN
jgi:hypothetical protein